MKTYSATVLAALASNSLALAALVNIAVPGGAISLNTSNWDLVWSGTTYKGAFGLGSISEISDAPGETQGLTLTLNGGDPTRISLALDATDVIQGSPVTIRTAIIETSTYTVLDAPIEWTGKADTMAISEDGETATITLTVESQAIDLLRGNLKMFSHVDQQALFAGDRAFEYVVSQADQPVVWPSREFFFK